MCCERFRIRLHDRRRGPAGLSAAIYLARFNRSALVLDTASGRSTTHETNDNYLGFPKGIPSRRLRELGRRQARRFGAEFARAKVTRIVPEDGAFRLEAGRRQFRGRTAIIATGVQDLFPDFPGVQDYVGRSLFWCITCDGYKVRGRRVVIVGHGDGAVTTCMQFLNFTDRLAFVTNQAPGRAHVTEGGLRLLRDAGVSFHEGEIANVEGRDGAMRQVVLETGERIAADAMFSLQGSVPKSELARGLGVKRSRHGFIKVDEEQRTNVPLLYAAGDVTRIHSHQIVTAAHEGATAGQAANYDLYRPEQRE